jgi:type VI secretion system protein ImpL
VGYDVSATFRVDQSAELEGNKIADWSLTIGDQTVQQRDAAKPLTWTPGLPVTLTLRLAKDAPLVPVADAKQPSMRVEGKTVSFQTTDPWALLTFVQRYRDAEANSRGDGRAQVLRFEFPIQTVGNDGRPLPGQTPTMARVYVKLGVQSPGKHANLAWPTFPYKAPAWAMRADQ